MLSIAQLPGAKVNHRYRIFEKGLASSSLSQSDGEGNHAQHGGGVISEDPSTIELRSTVPLPTSRARREELSSTPPKLAHGPTLCPGPAPSCRRRRLAAGRRPRASTADGRCGTPRRAASSLRCNPRRCRACPRWDGKRAGRRSSPDGRCVATPRALSGCIRASCCVAWTEKTSRSSGTTFQSPAQHHRPLLGSSSRACTPSRSIHFSL